MPFQLVNKERKNIGRKGKVSISVSEMTDGLNSHDKPVSLTEMK